MRTLVEVTCNRSLFPNAESRKEARGLDSQRIPRSQAWLRREKSRICCTFKLTHAATAVNYRRNAGSVAIQVVSSVGARYASPLHRRTLLTLPPLPPPATYPYHLTIPPSQSCQPPNNVTPHLIRGPKIPILTIPSPNPQSLPPAPKTPEFTPNTRCFTPIHPHQSTPRPTQMNGTERK